MRIALDMLDFVTSELLQSSSFHFYLVGCWKHRIVIFLHRLSAIVKPYSLQKTIFLYHLNAIEKPYMLQDLRREMGVSTLEDVEEERELKQMVRNIHIRAVSYVVRIKLLVLMSCFSSSYRITMQNAKHASTWALLTLLDR